MDTSQPSLEIDVVFDFVCPWCLIGKRHLAAALARLADLRPEVRPEVRWRSHQLLPDTPLSGVPYQAFYVARLGSAAAVTERRAQVQRAGTPAGIDFSFERIRVMPNTGAAHDLVAWAGSHGTAAQQAALIDSLFEAYFIEGEDIGDRTVLVRRALACGYARDGLAEALREPRPRLPALDVGGVPLFVFNGTNALSGAHAPDTLLQAMLRAIRA